MILEMLGTSRRGTFALRNEDLDALLGGRLYVVATKAHPLGEHRGQITP